MPRSTRDPPAAARHRPAAGRGAGPHAPVASCGAVAPGGGPWGPSRRRVCPCGWGGRRCPPSRRRRRPRRCPAPRTCPGPCMRRTAGAEGRLATRVRRGPVRAGFSLGAAREVLNRAGRVPRRARAVLGAASGRLGAPGGGRGACEGGAPHAPACRGCGCCGTAPLACWGRGACCRACAGRCPHCPPPTPCHFLRVTHPRGAPEVSRWRSSRLAGCAGHSSPSRPCCTASAHRPGRCCWSALTPLAPCRGDAPPTARRLESGQTCCGEAGTRAPAEKSSSWPLQRARASIGHARVAVIKRAPRAQRHPRWAVLHNATLRHHRHAAPRVLHSRVVAARVPHASRRPPLTSCAHKGESCASAAGSHV